MHSALHGQHPKTVTLHGPLHGRLLSHWRGHDGAVFTYTDLLLPEEDQGVFMTTAQLPSGSTMVNTSKVLGEITDYYLTKEQKTLLLFSPSADLVSAVRDKIMA